MSEDLKKHFQDSQDYLKLGDKEKFEGVYIGWESITTKFGRKGYRFTLERSSGKRITWDTSNTKAVAQMIDFDKGDGIEIVRNGVEKDNTVYTITKKVPF